MAVVAMRTVREVLGLGLGTALLLALAGAGLAWRLAQGPLDVTPLIRIAERLLPKGTVPAMALERASIAWNGFTDGAGSGLELRLTDLHTVGTTAGSGASVAQAVVTLAPLPLLSGTAVPRQVVLDGVSIRAVRSADGSLQLDVGGGGGSNGDLGDILAELRRPAGHEAEPSLAALRRLVVEHAHLAITDEVSGGAVSGDIADLDLRRLDAGGITGSATGRAVLGQAVLALRLSAELRPDGGTHWAATLQPVSTRPIDADVLARLDPALAGIGTLDATVQAQVSLEMSPALRPRQATFGLSLGAGTLAVPASAVVAFDRAAVGGAATWTEEGDWWPVKVRLDPAELVLAGASGRRSTVRVTADAARESARWTVRSTLALDAADFADLPSLWPAGWGGHVRPWLTENVSAGLAHDGAFTATAVIPLADPARAEVTQAGGTLQADNVTVHWLRPVPPVERAQATLTVTGPDDLVIAIPRAQQAGMALSNGVLRFTGLSHKDQDMALTATVQGGVPDLIRLLREPRLHLLDAHPIPISGSAGRVAGTLSVSLPLEEHLTFEQVAIGSKGRLTGLMLNGIVAGRTLDKGDVTFSVTQDGLSAAGTASLAGVPGRAQVEMDFRSGGPAEVTQQARFVGRVGAAALAAEGVDTGGALTGSALVDATYREQRDGQARLVVEADLLAAGVSVAGWRKPAGAAAQVGATVLLRDGRVTGVPSLVASGPGLSVSARAEMANGVPRVLRVDQLALGPTRLSGEVVFPAEAAEPLRVRVTGPVLDLSDQVKALGGGGPGRAGGTGGRGWVADARIGQVILGGGRSWTELAAHAEYGGGQLRSLQVSTGGAEQLRASVTPVPNGRRLLVQAADTGAILRGLDLTGTIGGGTLSVDASFDDRQPDPPLTGQVRLDGFGVRDEVVLGKLLQVVTVYGIVDALRRDGVYFAEAQVPFTLSRNVLRIGPSRMSSASLGITAEGWVDFERKALALTGTVVPAYAVNTALGRLPLVGELFSAEKDGGLFAAGFTVSGPTRNPSVSINPLSLLTPGILRRLFN